ncbi:MAG: NADH-quinone oxidoreductase subunit NuoE [Candidatus Cloacimonetes bacterium]|jgi:NADH-quinone oxidoreductase subunit E|nr:NADH-quinone oxidoreductase subunit NuoE [Candidatus Cloacimonadota bacterium]
MEINNVVEVVDECIQKNGNSLIPVLQDIQSHYNYLPEEIFDEVSQKMNIPLIDVYGVATFYKSFSLTPKGKHIITVCLGTACHVRGGQRIADRIARELEIEPGETTPDMNFTLETVNCLGACALGPVVVVNGEYHGQMTIQKSISLLNEYRNELEREEENDSSKS